jgi:hypothetical protein
VGYSLTYGCIEKKNKFDVASADRNSGVERET